MKLSLNVFGLAVAFIELELDNGQTPTEVVTGPVSRVVKAISRLWVGGMTT
ncbi:hypothetical protein KIP49_gp28 [Mycobacterium phage Scorpia]|uniref:Uncharacterized protein n=2 Tax=Benedictvirus TaxID=2946819 RepID=A0A482J658_9CAUD|nr:hypothetical protein AVV06_gp31 [Mycobacterium phage Chadwick]YP_010060775.1 hypothetical protein KIP49_gp28 [Mycobacterium phage Scorpia]ALA06791.1 hypothetical protein SEA_CHADWICK_64 [Mycobacterium phage Chadwick]QBP29063.1 hypothetical protein SEA_SCORPIA_64 [Mycobacterium phage Scorpia]